jgi:short-subunit dehydrogenase
MQIKNSVVIVTGASSGIGLATSRALAQQGARVALAARGVAKLEALAKELPESLLVPTDMTDLNGIGAMVDQTVAHYGRVDALVNNAGQAHEATTEAIEPEMFDHIFRLNVLAPVVAMQRVIPVMRAQGGGAIVNISSGTSLMRIPGYGVYSSSKRALNGFSLTAREELAADNIVVSLVYPFITATNFGVNKLVAGGGPSRTPASAYASGDTPEYVADIIVRALVEGEAEYFAHENMKHLGR